MNVSLGVHSIYIHTYIRVIQRFVTVAFTFLPILVAFNLAFGIAFPDEIQFRNFLTTFFRLSVMMQGEFDFEEYSQMNSTSSEIYRENNYSYLSSGLVSVFGIFIALVLANVFLGYTVSDIQVRI